MAEETTIAAEAPAPRKRAAKGEGKTPPRNIGPRPAYLLVNVPEGVDVSDIEVVSVTRKAEEALEAIDSGKAGAYLRLMVK